jgi:uncharacterized membrane protein YkoI|tara:strand:+ start:137 stop:508 length:372 start_codon:yes stop_codon:yes gene_type:complete
MQQFSRHVEQSSRTFLGGGTAVFAVILMGVVVIALPGALHAASASQARAPANSYVQPDRRVGRVINLNQAIRIAQEESGGKVLSAKSVRGPNGSLRHHVRMLVDGQRVTTLVVNQQGRLQRAR